MSNISMVMSFKCSNCCKIVLDHLRFSYNASYVVLMYKIDVKYQYAIRAVCADACVFRKRPGRALIGACPLIKMNTMHLNYIDIICSWSKIGVVHLYSL